MRQDRGGLGQAGTGLAVVPVDGLHRVVAEHVQVDTETVGVQHVEPMAAGCFQNAQIERLAKTAIFLAVEMQRVGPLCGVVDAGNTGARQRLDEANDALRDHLKTGQHGLRVFAQMSQQIRTCQMARLRQRAEDSHNHRHVGAKRFTGQANRLTRHGQVAATGIKHRQCQPVLGPVNDVVAIGARAFVAAAPLDLDSPVLGAIRAGWCDLQQVEIVGLLPPDVRGGQVCRALVVAGKMAPQGDSRSVNCPAGDRRLKPLAFVHGIHGMLLLTRS